MYVTNILVPRKVECLGRFSAKEGLVPRKVLCPGRYSAKEG